MTDEFNWDADNIDHLARHDISPAEFEEVMAEDPVFVDFRDDTGEDRWYVVGSTRSGRILFLAYTQRGHRIRAATGWDASKGLRNVYLQEKGLLS